MREKVGKSRFTVFFQWFVAPEGRKVGSLKRRVRSQLAGWEMKNCTPLWRGAHLQVKMYKTHHCRTTFGSCDVEKVHAVVARSTFASQNVQNTPLSDHFWKLRCRKSARRCGAKHIWKSKYTKHTIVGPLGDHWESINPGCEGNTVLVLGESMDPKDISCILICAVSLIYMHTCIHTYTICTVICVYTIVQ